MGLRSPSGTLRKYTFDFSAIIHVLLHVFNMNDECSNFEQPSI